MIKLENVYKTYNNGKTNEVKAIKNLSLTIEKGELVAIAGPSGAGKSTLLHVLGGLCNLNDGKYYFNQSEVNVFSEGEKSKFRNKNIGIVMQNFALIEEYSVTENVSLPLHFRKGVKNKKEEALSAIQKVGVFHLKDKPVSELSGGEKQRVAIARCLCQAPEVILADEPTGQLDCDNAKKIIDLLLDLNKTGLTVIVVTHDKEIASRFNRIITIKDGEIVSDTKN